MRRSSKALLRDPNQLAAEIVRLSTEEEAGSPDPSIMLSAYFAAMGRKGGLKGGKARAKRLSPSKRKSIAKKAAAARWKSKKTR
jgi:hypothetical protein